MRATTMHSNVATTDTNNSDIDSILEYYLCSEPNVCGSESEELNQIAFTLEMKQ